ncbi:MAG: OmpA family protein [Pyrinomonadaceae bacterium]|nr:OmpA family protein [Pyrinomonadaceae bacterium]MCX7638817.1 OmpA family protein [Pyrinomonadaceae bacterium]MDW8305047.1 OmpA family protein [Acidobacteriota bacterium]
MVKRVVFVGVLFLLLSTFTYSQYDIPRQTLAITYPRGETITVKFRGTTQFPRMSGEAIVKRTDRNTTEINLSVSKMPRPFELGAGYATYVLWAISPDGMISNLGEIKRRGFFEFDSKIRVTTPLQTFALIVTAEPHFLVRRPSRAIMLENVTAVAKSGKILQTGANITYFGNSSDFFNDLRTPSIAEEDYEKTPSTILQARQAIALAKYVGASSEATEELQEAEDLLQRAEEAWKAGRSEQEVEIIARRAIGAAVKAEEIAQERIAAKERRNERARTEAEIRLAEEKYLQAQEQIKALKEEIERERRSRELAERDVANLSNQIRLLRDENQTLRLELQQAKMRLAALEAEKSNLTLQLEKEQKQRAIRENLPILIESLKVYGDVKQIGESLVLVLSEDYFTGIRSATLKPQHEVRLFNLANLLSSNPYYRISIRAHTDDRGEPAELINLTQMRANLIAEKLVAGGVQASRIEAKGFGASMPVASNANNLSRMKNRRVEIFITAEL